MPFMLENLKNLKTKWLTNWVNNFAKSVDNRTGWFALLNLFNQFCVNLGIFTVWFAFLITVLKLAVNYGFLSNNDAVTIGIWMIDVMALTHLVIFVYSKFGVSLITIIAEFIAQAFREGFLYIVCIVGSPAVAKIPEPFYSFHNHIPQVPCAPPRMYLA
jgi:hypothetical protein